MTLLSTALVFLLGSTGHAQDVPPWRAAGYYAHEPIRESSGLVASRTHVGIYWTLNDSGNPAALYATGLDGKLIREFEVRGATNRDWEALAIDNEGQLWIGEIGNNSRGRTNLRVYVVSEPDPKDETATISVLKQYPYRYPAENVDAEGMFVHEGMPYIISKEASRAVLYRFTELEEDEPHTLGKVGELASDAYRITGASLSEDGMMLAAVTYGRLWIYHSVRPINLVNLIRSEPWSMPHNFGVEACAFNGKDLVMSNEARSIFVLPEYWYKRGDSLPPTGALSAQTLHQDKSKSKDGRIDLLSYADVGIPIPGKQLVLTAQGPEASLTQTIEISRDDLWEVNTIVTRGPNYGRFELLVDGERVGSPYDCGASENTAGTVATFGTVHLAKGTREFTMRLSGEPAGKRIGLDGYLIQAASPFAQRFMVAGPFVRSSDDHIDDVLGPESPDLNLSDTYEGVDGRKCSGRFRTHPLSDVWIS
jgi:hypothetical protein